MSVFDSWMWVVNIIVLSVSVVYLVKGYYER